MELDKLMRNGKFHFKISGTDYKTAVQNFSAEERISGLYEVNLHLVSEDKIHFNDAIQKQALLTIAGKNGDRHFHGLINHFMLMGKGGRFHFYQDWVVPALWFLSLDKDFRSFQDMTTEQIVTEVLEENNILSDSYEFRLANDYQKRRYCSQYGESDLHFVSRLLEEEGIFYFFEHSEKNHLLVFSDDETAYLKIAGETTIKLHQDGGMVAKTEVIDSFSYLRSICAGAVTQTNYNFKRPSLPLKVKKEGDTHDDYEVYEYPGLYGYPSEGDKVVQMRLEENKALEQLAQGSGNCARFTPGFKFSMNCHDFNDMNTEYALVSVKHAGEQSHVTGEYSGIGGDFSYSNEFFVIPASVIFRPEKIHKKPVVYGLHPAVVVGPPGEEIHVDEFCRVKVQFPWDRKGQNNEKSSCWVRVVQSWGGGGYGAINIPRIGDEVVIAFQNGDPDWPILVGSVYNAANMPINDLNKSVTQTGIKTKTHKGDGFHELRFDDAKGSEEIFLHSQKDWNIVVKDRKGQTVGGDSSTVIAKNREESVGGDSYCQVTGKQTEIAREVTISVRDKFTVVCGGNSFVITPQDIKINGLRVDINDGSTVSPPEEQSVTGATGESGSGGGAGGGGGGSGASGKKGKAKKSPSGDSGGAGGDKDSGNAPTTGPDNGAGSSTPAQPNESAPENEPDQTDDPWKIVPVENNAAGLGDFVSSAPSASMAKETGLSGAGDLVSSATSSMPAGLENTVAGVTSTIGNAAAIEDTVAHGARDYANRAVDDAKRKTLEQAAAEANPEAARELEKLSELLKSPKIKKDDLLKKF